MNIEAENLNEPQNPQLNIAAVSGSTNISDLFSKLKLIGWGDNRTFSNTQEDIDFALKVIEGMGSTGLVIRRADYLERGGKKNINEWYKELMKKDNFQSYMMNNFNLINGEFIIEKNIELLNNLSGVLLSYYR